MLTAAHCMITKSGAVVNPSKIVAFAGDYFLNQFDTGEENSTATRIRVHENYNP